MKILEAMDSPGGQGFLYWQLWHPAETSQISSHEKLYKPVPWNTAIESLYTDSSKNIPVRENFHLLCIMTVESPPASHNTQHFFRG